MRRLREEHDSADPDVAAAARLLGWVGPLTPSRLTQRRVRHQLECKHTHQAARRLRPIVAIGVLCGLAATASAGWGVLQAVSSSDPEITTLEAPVVPRVVPLAPHTAKSPPLVRPSSPAPSSSVEAASEAPASALAPRSSGRHAAAKPSKPARVVAASDAALVHDAVQELRRGGDPERARRLLEQYRSENPSGELAEEALVLSIEAAVAKGDPDAKRLARQYLAKYPSGRFVGAARRVLR